MPPRRLTKKVGQKHEMEAFAEKYDTLALIYGDPVETVFSIMNRNTSGAFPDDEVALRAADMLLSYRFPRVKAAEPHAPPSTHLNFNVIMGKPGEIPVNKAPQLGRPVLVPRTAETKDE